MVSWRLLFTAACSKIKSKSQAANSFIPSANGKWTAYITFSKKMIQNNWGRVTLLYNVFMRVLQPGVNSYNPVTGNSAHHSFWRRLVSAGGTVLLVLVLRFKCRIHKLFFGAENYCHIAHITGFFSPYFPLKLSFGLLSVRQSDIHSLKCQGHETNSQLAAHVSVVTRPQGPERLTLITARERPTMGSQSGWMTAALQLRERGENQTQHTHRQTGDLIKAPSGGRSWFAVRRPCRVWLTWSKCNNNPED